MVRMEQGNAQGIHKPVGRRIRVQSASTRSARQDQPAGGFRLQCASSVVPHLVGLYHLRASFTRRDGTHTQVAVARTQRAESQARADYREANRGNTGSKG